MTKHLSLLAGALLLTGASSAFAASSTDLTVTGTITPVACTPSLPNGGVVNYGKISVKDLNPTQPTYLRRESIQLTVNCDASTRFAISSTDNRPNTSNQTGDVYYGLGLINGSEKLGNYRLGFANPIADKPVTLIVSTDKGDTWQEQYEHLLISRSKWVGFGNNTSGAWNPDALQAVTADIWFNPQIAPTNNLTLTDEVRLDGSATLQIEYL